MISKLILAGLACMLASGPALAQKIAGWDIQKSASPMDDSQNLRYVLQADTPITDSLGRNSRPRLVLSCSRGAGKLGSVRLFVLFDNKLFTNPLQSSRVRVRFDDGKVDNQTWEPSSDGAYLFWEPESLDALRASKVLHLEFNPPLNTPQHTKFSLKGADGAVDGVLDACTMTEAERAIYDAEEISYLKTSWLRDLPDTRRGKAYDLAYNFLVAKGRIEGAPFVPVIGLDGPPPMPAEDVLDRLLAYMIETSLCVYPTVRSCPTTFNQSVRMDYLAGIGSKSTPESNAQWNPRARFLKAGADSAGE